MKPQGRIGKAELTFRAVVGVYDFDMEKIVPLAEMAQYEAQEKVADYFKVNEDEENSNTTNN